MWHRWQSIGIRTTSMRSFDDPCGSWQVAQFSRTGACSHNIGPRISVWQLTHSSDTELPVLRFLTLLIEPCGLWHELHDSFPSRTGMCATARSVFATCSRWQVTQTCVCVGATSCRSGDFGLCTLWQVVHDRLRRSCALPSQPACSPRLWHDRHVSLIAAGVSSLIFLMCPLASSSTCAWPGPWQLSQPWVAAGVRGSFACECFVPLSDSPSCSWQTMQVSDPA